MQRLRVPGEPEAVFAAIQERLKARGIEPRLVDPSSITLLFDMDVSEKGPSSTFFLCVIPAEAGGSDVALARRRGRRLEDAKAMVLGEEDPIEAKVLRELAGQTPSGRAHPGRRSKGRPAPAERDG